MKPLAYWRMSEFSGPEAIDISGNGNHATYEDYIAFYLPGPDRPNFSGEKVNRAAHFAGGRVRANIKQLNDNYTVNMWIWNGFPTDARDVTGYIFSRGPDGGKGDCLGIGGKGKCQGKLFFAAADGTIIEGTTKIPMKTWQHVVLMRDGEKLAIFLEGTVEISATLKTSGTNSQSQIFIGGSSENKFNFEGKIDEVALFNRSLKPNETA